MTSTFERLERRQHGRDVGAEQHLAAVGQQRDRGLDRDGAAGGLERLAGAEDRGLDLEDVLRRLDDDEVGAALDQAARLLGEDLDQLAEADLAERRVVGGGQVTRSGRSSPATKRSSPAALRAISAALVLISSVWSARPHSSSLSREAWKVSVSTTSAPASSIEAWTPSITSGRLSTSASWHLPASPP